MDLPRLWLFVTTYVSSASSRMLFTRLIHGPNSSGESDRNDRANWL
jgi:hypothetical protein